MISKRFLNISINALLGVTVLFPIDGLSRSAKYTIAPQETFAPWPGDSLPNFKIKRVKRNGILTIYGTTRSPQLTLREALFIVDERAKRIVGEALVIHLSHSKRVGRAKLTRLSVETSWDTLPTLAVIPSRFVMMGAQQLSPVQPQSVDPSESMVDLGWLVSQTKYSLVDALMEEPISPSVTTLGAEVRVFMPKLNQLKWLQGLGLGVVYGRRQPITMLQKHPQYQTIQEAVIRHQQLWAGALWRFDLPWSWFYRTRIEVYKVVEDATTLNFQRSELHPSTEIKGQTRGYVVKGVALGQFLSMAGWEFSLAVPGGQKALIYEEAPSTSTGDIKVTGWRLDGSLHWKISLGDTWRLHIGLGTGYEELTYTNSSLLLQTETYVSRQAIPRGGLTLQWTPAF